MWAWGEPDATVTLTPAAPAGHGPVYFDETVTPNLELAQTTRDGGALFFNLPPGNYQMQGHKAGVAFDGRLFTCRAGWLVNASPPFGVQAL